MKERTKFIVDKNKCIKCGRCINTCSGMIIEFGEDGYPEMKEFERWGILTVLQPLNIHIYVV